jgi:hypothetical protein
VLVVWFGFLKYIIRRCVDEEVDSQNESKLSEPSTSKTEKEATKKFAFTTTFTWHGFYMYGIRKLPASNVHYLREKTIKYGYGPNEVKSTLHNKSQTPIK